MDRLKAMAVFLKIVDTGNFTQAAKQLDMPVASVSYHMTKLEHVLGTRLLNRTTRKVSLTDLGRDYAERCRYIINEVEEAENILTNLKSEPQGDLTINAPISFGMRYLSKFLSEFMNLYPKVRINLTLSDQLVDVMESGCDVILRISKPADSTHLIRKLTPIKIIFCASPAYLKSHGAPKKLADLSHHNCLQYRYYQGKRWQATGPNGIEKIKINGTLISNNDENLKYVAQQGHGIIFIPAFVVHEELESGKLVHVLEEYCEPEIFLYALYPYSRSLSAKTRLFIDFMVQQFESKPW